MRKLSVFTMTALAAVMMAGMPAITSQASIYTFRVPAGMSENSANIYFSNQNISDGSQMVETIFGNFDCNQGMPGLPGMPEMPGMPEIPGQPGMPGQSEMPEQSGMPEQSQRPESDGYVEAVLKLVNEERAKAGAGALTLDAGAQEAANVRAAEIQRAFSHTRPDGSNFSTALLATGIRYTSSGENIAYGQSSPQEVMQGWMNSPGHRANILNKDFTYIGIGHMEAADGVDYWAQLFYR